MLACFALLATSLRIGLRLLASLCDCQQLRCARIALRLSLPKLNKIKLMFSFQNLNVYQESRQLVRSVYLLLEKFPSKEQYALCDQLRRCVVSVPSNIAEGISRKSFKEQSHFLDISYGSLMEVLCQMEISLDLQYINKEEYDMVFEQIKSISIKIINLKRKINNK